MRQFLLELEDAFYVAFPVAVVVGFLVVLAIPCK